MTDERVLHILLVEDDEVDVMNVRRAFEKNKILNPLYVAADGLEALTMLRDGRVPRQRRLVLLDLNMPGMNGFEFLRELRADSVLKLTPVVVLTTSNDEKDKIEAFDLNVAGYLVKPVTFPGFAELIQPVAVVGRHRRMNVHGHAPSWDGFPRACRKAVFASAFRQPRSVPAISSMRG